MSSFGKAFLAGALGAGILGSPALARSQDEAAATAQPDAKDVAMTPLTDLNLSKDDIPPVLLVAATDPYASDGLKKCKDIAAAVAELDSVLGPDMDVAENDNDRISWGKVATSAVGSFIPFRGILRELTGAAEHKRAFQTAIYAGAVRRGFLKGLGQQKGCAYPARPASTRVTFMEDKKSRRKRAAQAGNTGAVTFVSAPVVQDTSLARRERP
jgi:hypothetical protein